MYPVADTWEPTGAATERGRNAVYRRQKVASAERFGRWTRVGCRRGGGRQGLSGLWGRNRRSPGEQGPGLDDVASGKGITDKPARLSWCSQLPRQTVMSPGRTAVELPPTIPSAPLPPPPFSAANEAWRQDIPGTEPRFSALGLFSRIGLCVSCSIASSPCLNRHSNAVAQPPSQRPADN